MESIYKLWQGRFTEAWYQLPQEEQQRLLGQLQQSLNTVGGKDLILCSATWSNERWPYFGVTEYPNLEAAQRQTQILTESNWMRYFEARTTLGTRFTLPE
jgi:hypothetical protein